jgi:hypothetical protein
LSICQYSKKSDIPLLPYRPSLGPYIFLCKPNRP